MKPHPARARRALAKPILARAIDTWTAELRAKAAGTEVWTVDGASQTSGLATAPAETRVIGFVDQAICN